MDLLDTCACFLSEEGVKVVEEEWEEEEEQEFKRVAMQFGIGSAKTEADSLEWRYIQ